MSKPEDKKKSIGTKLIAILILAAVIVLTIFFIAKFFGSTFAELFSIMQTGDEEQMKAYLSTKGEAGGLFSVFMMSVLQVVSIFIPGIIIQMSAGAIYGWWKAFLMTYFGFVFGNVLVFYAARRLGSRVSDILELGKKSNWLEDKVNHYSPTFVLALAYLIPGIPNGFIPYFASRLDIRMKNFAIAVSASSWIQILCDCLAGHFMIRENYLFMIISFSVEIVLIIAAYRNRNFILSLSGRRKKKDVKQIAMDAHEE